jgi:NTE family protein
MNTTSLEQVPAPSTADPVGPITDRHESVADAISPRPRVGERALVLGGGGSTGNAWLIGVVAGLFEAGLDVTGPDLTVGTSAGATAAVQLAGAAPVDLLAAVLAAVPPPGSGPVGSGSGRVPGRPVADQLARLRGIIAAAQGPADLRRRLGAAALVLEAESDGSWTARWRTTVGARLPGARWPARSVFITAVDAATGEPVVFDRHGEVDVVDAVAASCSSGLPYRIGERRFLDGGYRLNAENADLASGHDRVLVLSPFGGRSLTPREWGTHLATQVDELRAGGSRVETIFPDADAEHLFGTNAMDPSLRPAAARAGQRQGRVLAERIAGFWS